MAERVFDYEKIADIYKSMNDITGDAGTPGTIAGILEQCNQEIENKVNVSEQAIFGDLGSQLKLDWDNFSSGFPNFVANFNNWATVVAKANNDYTQFEQDVQGFRDTHQFGVAAATNMTDAFVNTGYYSNAHTADEIADLQSLASFYQLTGASYTDTGMVAYAKKAGFWNAVGDILNVAAIVMSGYTIVSQVGKMISVAKNVGDGGVRAAQIAGATGSTNAEAQAAKSALRHIGKFQASDLVKYNRTIIEKFARTGLGTRLMSTKVGSTVLTALDKPLIFMHYFNSTGTTAAGTHLAYQYSVQGLRPIALGAVGAAAAGTASNAVGDSTPYSLVGSPGTVYQMNNSLYTYCGTTTSGNNLYIDENDNIVYKASDGTMQSVTNSSGAPVTMNSIDNEASLIVGGVDVGNADTLTGSMNMSEISTEQKDYADYMGVADIRTSASSEPEPVY